VTEATQIGKPLIKPVIYDRTFDDPDDVRRIIADNSPYEWMMRDYPAEYRASADGKPFYLPWFRHIWRPDTAHIKRRGELLYYAPFIEGARQSFVGFEIVRPEVLLVNIMAPLPNDGPHFDLPHFRGLPMHGFPTWFLMAVGRSELFERWHVNIASALTWLYRGEGGGFAYWADGPAQPPRRMQLPIENRMLVSDNQRMYHMVERFGDASSLKPFAHSRDAELVSGNEGGWDIVDDGRVVKHFKPDEIRISILWRGVMHKDAEAARIYDEHLDDITAERAAAILVDGARRKGCDIPLPADPLNDTNFMLALDKAFPRPMLAAVRPGDPLLAAA
jgi:hypothetical protein